MSYWGQYVYQPPEGHVEWTVEGADLMCADGFEREFWRGICECGFKSKYKFYRSWAAEDEMFTHQVDVQLREKCGERSGT